MEKCFTLVELIVVIAIIAILAAIIAPSAFKAIEKSKISRATADLRSIKTASLSFYADTGTWPIPPPSEAVWLDNSGLITNNGNWPGWDGPYLEKSLVMHPWKGVMLMGIWNMGVGGAAKDYTIKLWDCCYPSGPEFVCTIPISSAQKIDQTIDDGNLGSGDLTGGANIWWIISKDCCP